MILERRQALAAVAAYVRCPVCGDSPTITEYIDYVEFCTR